MDEPPGAAVTAGSPAHTSAGDPRVRRYHLTQLLVSGLGTALSAGVLLAWVGTGGARALAEGALAWVGGRGGAVALVGAVIFASAALARIPLDVLSGFILPRRAGLLTQSWRGWLVDQLKWKALSAAIGLVILQVVYGLLAWSPGWWWLWGAAILTLLLVLMVALVPVLVVPLFYRVRPLEDADLSRQLLLLATRVGVRATGVLVADLSRKGPAANAAVVGLGRTRRILVSDTLIEGFPRDEVLVVLAHELAHHARGHLYQGLLLQGGVLVVSLGLAHVALERLAAPLGLAGAADPAGLPALALILGGIGFGATPLVAAWSRRLEREADRVALELTLAPRAFMGAMERLGSLSFAERRPGRLRQLLFHTHPSLEERIATARRMAERLAEAT
jgi:STE24 endopeptidase